MKAIAVAVTLTISLAGSSTLVFAQVKGEGEMDKIRGTWAIVAGEKAGRKAPAADLKGAKMTFSDGEFAWKAGGRETKGTFTLDATKAPGEITIETKDKKLAGIYKLENDELKICVGIDNDRPEEFATEAGSKSLLLVLKREKP